MCMERDIYKGRSRSKTEIHVVNVNKKEKDIDYDDGDNGQMCDTKDFLIIILVNIVSDVICVYNIHYNISYLICTNQLL